MSIINSRIWYMASTSWFIWSFRQWDPSVAGGQNQVQRAVVCLYWGLEGRYGIPASSDELEGTNTSVSTGPKSGFSVGTHEYVNLRYV